MPAYKFYPRKGNVVKMIDPGSKTLLVVEKTTLSENPKNNNLFVHATKLSFKLKNEFGIEYDPHRDGAKDFIIDSDNLELVAENMDTVNLLAL